MKPDLDKRSENFLTTITFRLKCIEEQREYLKKYIREVLRRTYKEGQKDGNKNS